MRLLLKTGEIRDIEISSSVVTYDNQMAMQVSFRDVTRKKIIENELRLAKNQAERATALKDRFVTIVSHDLKAPLASTISMLRLLEKSLSVRQETLDRQLIHRPVAALETMYKMIERLLDISLLQAGAIKIQKKVIDLHDLGAETVSILAPVAEQKGVTIRMGIPKGFRVLADPNLMFEVMNNLVANAIKFSHVGGTVTIDKFNDELACFLVRDTGVGIDFNNIPALLGQENKTSTPGTSGERGSGLGLSFCAEIIKAHGGTMAIDSELGKGSTFRVCLPQMEAKGVAENNPASVRDPKPPAPGSQCCTPPVNRHLGHGACIPNGAL
jgi:signal transduction histidine kinase